MVVWGGTDFNSIVNSGARYFPANDSWRPISPGTAPRARAQHTGVWTGSRTVIWGGQDSQGILNDGASYCSCVNWYRDVDGDTYGEFGGALSVCDGSQPAGYVGRYGDCNDGNAAVHPGAPDNSCNGADDDCDGPTDEDYLTQPSVCGQGVCRSFGTLDCVNGTIVNSCVPGTPNSPTDPSCNTLDDDCDGAVDEDFPQTDDHWTATTNAPAARTNYTAVWSGSEMIVFGGDNGSGTVQTGGYAYAWGANTWRALAAGPAKRWRHTATWTGTRMVVWGGDDNIATIHNTGSRYDPSTDTWAATNTTGAPTARGLHSAVWTGSRVVIWGGRDAASAVNTGSRYDPTGNTWSATTTTSAPTARFSHTAVWAGSEMIVWGGQNTSGTALNTGSRYDPVANTWTAITTTGAPSARFGHVAVWTGSEMIVWGGTTDGNTYLFDGAKYNPQTNSWTSIPNLGAPSRRAYASHVWTGSELLVWGGMYKTNEEPNTPLGTGARYNPSTNAWVAVMATQITPPSPRARAAAVWTGTEMIVWGGDPVGGALATGGIYNPRTLCGIGGCQQVGLTSCSAGAISFQCTPGVPFTESCDNIDNDCDGFIDDNIPAPTTHPVVFGVKNGGSLMYWWVATPDTTAYDVVRGNLGTLRSSGGNFTTSLDTCLVNDIRTEAVTDNTAPGGGAGFWYLVRSVNACSGLGTYDDTSPPQIGLRDAEIAASSAACP
jgi:N-acetylneuraminic acid mutarotase